MFTNFTDPLNTTRILPLPDVINTTYLNITFHPTIKRLETRDSFNLALFEFYWTPISYIDKELIIQLNFTQPEEISTDD